MKPAVAIVAMFAVATAGVRHLGPDMADAGTCIVLLGGSHLCGEEARGWCVDSRAAREEIMRHARAPAHDHVRPHTVIVAEARAANAACRQIAAM